ncbi:ribonuclease III [Peptostreptococcus sp.]|jgi:ribonuclease III|uniref:ribonuclease III n=1 Tax=Peptostreptococcus sp. TaxID=1262 RepID=UPI001CACA3F8|nr:ribonuclease III [Peptostreptococcus sp.]MBF1049519.1 ribonuclease III [Peptostreptococcus sp.]MBF1059003.1 ribonuclease III [Peptostreptococcus sp.]
MASINDVIKESIRAFEEKIGYEFKDKTYIQTALTHSSFANEHKEFNYNERLEFLGDSVLGLVVSDYLFRARNDLPEGKLTRLRANVVCEESLSAVARKINLGDHLFLGKGEKASGGSNRDSILADATEAVIAAIYLDGGFDQAKDFILSNLRDTIAKNIDGNIFRDYKTILQEIIQGNNGKISYKLVGESGPDHNKEFEMQVKCGQDTIGIGKGKNKKEAEKEAARDALVKMGEL